MTYKTMILQIPMV